jgi:cyclic-di-GMP phosphodiesterase TipF (flagellum assembly factor)
LFLGIDQGRAVYLGIILAMVSFIAAVLGRMGAGGKRSSESRLYAELQVLAGRLGAQEQKINELERRTVESPAMVWRAAANDIDVLGSLVRDLAKTVAGHDERLNQILPAPSGTVAEIFREPGTPSSEGDAETVGAPNMEPTAMVNGAGTANEDAVDYARIVRNALSSDRLELCLQPLVTLPQRRTVAYEATLQLRAEGEATALRGELRRLAQAASLTFDLDMTLVRRAVQVMRVLRARERDVDIVCAVAASTLADERFGDELDAAAEGDATLKAKLLLDIAAADWDAAPAGALRAATAKGCHLAVHGFDHLNLDMSRLTSFGVKQVRVDAALIARAMDDATLAADIHPADAASLLRRAQITLVAVGVQDETTVVDLLDMDVPVAQGGLFGHPRAVRSEVLTAPAEVSVVRASSEAEASPAPNGSAPQNLPAVGEDGAATADPAPTPPVRTSFRSLLRRANA